MSHLHSVTGISIASDQYQAYLDRMHDARMKEEAEKLRRMQREKSFEACIDPDSQPDEGPGQDPQEDAEQETKGEPGDGFGSHYA